MSEAWPQLLLAIALLAGPVLTGCLGTEDSSLDPAGTSDEPILDCDHPNPCEDPNAWPEDLSGPFEILEPERVRVESFDGTMLSGVVWRPDVPEGVEVPVVIESTPYAEQLNPPADDQAYLDGAGRAGYIFNDLLENGFAVAIFSVRGTGHSGGCFDFWGTAEQRDQAEIVAWAAEQDWSNGRVGMYGLSYMGTTPWAAAIQAPPALKTILVSGVITHPYLAGFTPQGAAWSISGGPYALGFGGTVGMGPRATGALDDPTSLVEHPGVEPCPQSLWALSGMERSTLLDQRDTTWVEDRAMIERFGDVSAAVLYTAGYEDGDVHQFQDDAVWHALTDAPKRMVTGHWGHEFPDGHVEALEDDGGFRAFQLAWFNHWLKGVGGPAELGVGTVTYETVDGTWNTSEAWPPDQARDETLYLSPGGLAPEPAPGQTTLVNAPAPAGASTGLCTGAQGETLPTNTATFELAIEEPVDLAGNPMAYLTLSTDGPGGVVSVELWRVPEGEDACIETDGSPSAHWLAYGAADLRYHAGNLAARDFPTDTPTPVRVDLWSTGARLSPGDTLVLTASWELLESDGKPLAGTITIHGGQDADASHVLLPVVDGSLGGDESQQDYPPRPFAPEYPR